MSRREGKRCCEVKWWYCADEVACDSFATEQAKRAIDVKVSPRDDPVAPYRFRPQLQLHMLASLAPQGDITPHAGSESLQEYVGHLTRTGKTPFHNQSFDPKPFCLTNTVRS